MRQGIKKYGILLATLLLLAGVAWSQGVFNTVGPTAANQHTLPNVTSDTVTLLTATQTLGNKSLTTVLNCGAVAANAACANTVGTLRAVTGNATLSGSTSTITGISPAFTSSSSYYCVANDITTRANVVQAVPASGSSLTITNTTGATDVISFICLGN